MCDKEQIRILISENLCVDLDQCTNGRTMRDLGADSLSLLSLYVDLNDECFTEEMNLPDNVFELRVVDILEFAHDN